MMKRLLLFVFIALGSLVWLQGSNRVYADGTGDIVQCDLGNGCTYHSAPQYIKDSVEWYRADTCARGAGPYMIGAMWAEPEVFTTGDLNTSFTTALWTQVYLSNCATYASDSVSQQIHDSYIQRPDGTQLWNGDAGINFGPAGNLTRNYGTVSRDQSKGYGTGMTIPGGKFQYGTNSICVLFTQIQGSSRAEGGSCVTIYVMPPPEITSINASCSQAEPKLDVSWDGAAANGFWVDVDNDDDWSNGYISAQEFDPYTYSATVPGFALTSGQTYWVRVFSNQSGSFSNTVTAQAGACFNPATPRVTTTCSGVNSVGTVTWDRDTDGGQYYILLGYGSYGYGGWATDNIANGTTSASIPSGFGGAGSGLDQSRTDYWVMVRYKRTGQEVYTAKFAAKFCPPAPTFTHACSGRNSVVNISWTTDPGGGQYYMLLGYGPNKDNYAGWAKDNIPNSPSTRQLPSGVDGAGATLDPNRTDYYVILDYKRTGTHFSFYIGNPRNDCIPPAPTVTHACVNGRTEATISWITRGSDYYFVDISKDSNFGSYWWKGDPSNTSQGGAFRSGTSSTNAPDGFSGSFYFTAGDTYYARVYYSSVGHSKTSLAFTPANCDRPPTITVTSDCPNKRVNVTVNDPDGNPSTFSYTSKNTITNAAGPSGSGRTANPNGTADMSGAYQYDPYTVTATSQGFAKPGNNLGTAVSGSGPYGNSPTRGCQDRSFVITAVPSTSVSPDSESPTTATFIDDFNLVVTPAGQGVKLSPPPRGSLRKFYIVRVGGATTDLAPTNLSDTNSGNPFPEGTPSPRTTPSRTYNPETRGLGLVNAGDKICTSINISPKAGTVDAVGNIITVTQNSEFKEACETVTNKPYLKAYGGSVWAGSKFMDTPAGAASSCSPGYSSSEIRTTAGFDGTKVYGSSAQYAAMALGNIKDNGFFSAGVRGAPNGTTGYLTFANNGFSASGDWGNGLGGSGHCIVDFYDAASLHTRFPATSGKTGTLGSATVNINDASLNDGWQYYRTGNLTISNTGANQGRRITFYVDGDVFIDNNIAYSGLYPSNASIPYISVIARGNIYIDNDVSKVSGLFVAQPGGARGASGGQIYTCADPFSPMPNGRMIEECGGIISGNACTAGITLEIFGAFIARNVNFHRTNGSLRCAKAAAYPEGFNTLTSGEKFYLAPELYIGEPVFRARGGQGGSDFGEAHSYTNLPPIF